MSVLLWWVPALLVVVIASWRMRARRPELGEKDLRRMRRVLSR